MSNEVVTLESIAAQLTSIRDEHAEFRVDLQERFVRSMSNFVRIENACFTIKVAIGHLQSRTGAAGPDTQILKELSELRTRIDQLEAQLTR